ncbi:MAG: BtrH N-terminal domain-containing protein [Thermodesulfobacteriota bacterium]
MKINFSHRQSAHCESGVAAALASHCGIPLSEPMAFGIGGGLFFGYFPFIKMGGMPLTTYRSATGHILKRLCANLQLKIHSRTFRSAHTAMASLDEQLAAGVPVGLQTSVFWLPYFPKAYRFHFNGHNLVVFGKEGDDYLISDPVFPAPVRCPAADLARARFAPGPLAPKGRMYYLEKGGAPDVEAGIGDGIRYVAKVMTRYPFFLIGVRGIRFLSGRLAGWPERLGRKKADLHLGHVVRMQEEIGTGGGGFRFLFSDFLREGSERLSSPALAACARDLSSAGDRWREFAVMAARICKGRAKAGDSYAAMAAIIGECGKLEEELFARLHRIGRDLK